jgi:hypothetical protein
MKLAVRAFENAPVRSRTAVLAHPLDQSAVRLDHLKCVWTRVDHDLLMIEGN